MIQLSFQSRLDNHYWLSRSEMMYYKYIEILVKVFAYNAKSIIDVGSANTKYLESFDWIPHKYTLGIENRYDSPNVTSIEEDFLKYTPKNKFDFATCLQVLEQTPNVEEFAKKLFDISDKVLISVSYVCAEEIVFKHIDDLIEKLKKWTGKEPRYSIIITENVRNSNNGTNKTLLCYYETGENKINLDDVPPNYFPKLNKEIGS
mgnify:CR=1 FL=1